MHVFVYIYICMHACVYACAYACIYIPIATVASRCLLGSTFLDFDLAPKRNEQFGYCLLDFDIAPVIKLVSLTWLLWALSFLKFTFHYITCIRRHSSVCVSIL